ncbi:DUF5655 domain-containing protein [Microbacterium sp. M3]|uniref:DUF5655 domain-containing protein n=1 Tax=Microbacterium arthrosphaerae TaxID=792652 RepID=A0ABU4H3F6_9MICO|nr:MULTISPECIES: DUF5655 domain-containing protein [Microbacterium]MDW4573200.1 DUF5655 domain-containing protein [Microbacterium arthrosphaerae]MDW7607055.1 DUF5655 domain-containing protein [Microbacterium sp. M3]
MTDSHVWTVDDHLRDADPAAVRLWQRIDDLIGSFGPVTRSVSKTTITFKGTRRGFAGARPWRTGVRGYFDLMRELPADPRISGAAPYGRKLFVHQFRLADESELDEAFAAWLREAYEVGCGAHLGP